MASCCITYDLQCIHSISWQICILILNFGSSFNILPSRCTFHVMKYIWEFIISFHVTCLGHLHLFCQKIIVISKFIFGFIGYVCSIIWMGTESTFPTFLQLINIQWKFHLKFYHFLFPYGTFISVNQSLYFYKTWLAFITERQRRNTVMCLRSITWTSN